jgi:hypothetical protein
MARSARRAARLRRVVAKRAARKRKKFGSRSKRQRRRWPGIVWWSLGVIAGLASLGALAHLHGNPPDREGGFPDPALATLAEPAVAAALALGALLLVAWCVRRLRFEFLAWWPGRIVVRNFTADEQVPKADVERLTATFRDRLGMSHLQSPASVPAAAEQGDFLDVLARGGVESGNLFGVLLTLLRAAVPTHAYEIDGALVTREEKPSWGVTVHVVRLPGKGAGGHTIWDSTWEGAVRQAADHATAAMLPRTRICRSPWSAWRRYYMPPELLQAYEQAAECETERRYDDALHFYYQALREDPMNHGLRLQIGFLQEKLGLYLDALDTYGSIITVAEPAGRHSGAPGAGLDQPRNGYRGNALRDFHRTLLAARYRRAVLLGGSGLPHQWRKLRDEPQLTKRDKERARLRERLLPALEELFEAACSSDVVEKEAEAIYIKARRARPQPEDFSGAPNMRNAGDKFDPDRSLEQLLLLASLHQLEDLKMRLLDMRPRYRPKLSAAAVCVSSLIVKERLRLELDGKRGKNGRNWGPYLDRVATELDSIDRSFGLDDWQESYNAACVYSLPLLETRNSVDREDVKKLARRAVKCLKRATERADSAYIASRRDWLTSEDPDLEGLRVQPSFKRFEAAYFPSASRTPRRPRNVHKWQVSRYTLDLLRTTAGRWEDEWEERAQAADQKADTRELLRWWQDELSARRLFREVAVHHRDWRTRYKLLQAMRSWSVEYEFEPVEVVFPDFPAEEGLDLDDRKIEQATTEQIKDKDARLKAAVKQLAQAYDPGKRDVLERAQQVGTLRRPDIARICWLHANMWGRLRELVTPGAGYQVDAAEFARALDQTARACGRPTGAGSTDRSPARVNGNDPAAAAVGARR